METLAQPNLSFLQGVQGPVFPQHNNLGSFRFKDGVVHLEEYFGREGYHPKGFKIEDWKR